MNMTDGEIIAYWKGKYNQMAIENERLVKEVERLRNKVAAMSLSDEQLHDEIVAVDAVCDHGFGEGGGSPGEWWYERADELEFERKRRELEAGLRALAAREVAE